MDPGDHRSQPRKRSEHVRYINLPTCTSTRAGFARIVIFEKVHLYFSFSLASLPLAPPLPSPYQLPSTSRAQTPWLLFLLFTLYPFSRVIGKKRNKKYIATLHVVLKIRYKVRKRRGEWWNNNKKKKKKEKDERGRGSSRRAEKDFLVGKIPAERADGNAHEVSPGLDGMRQRHSLSEDSSVEGGETKI